MRKQDLLKAVLVVTLMFAWTPPHIMAQANLRPKLEGETLQFMKDNFPKRHKKMLRMRQEHPQRFRSEMKKRLPRYRELRRLKDDNPKEYSIRMKFFKLEAECQGLAEQYSEADATSQQQIKEKLIEKLSALFDMKHLHQQKRVKRIEKKLSKLKNNLEMRDQNREKIIEKRLGQLLDEAGNLAW